jgi:hypothetical protein
MAHQTQIERIKGKLARDGYITRNQCLRTFPAITRLGARIDDLERFHGYVFSTENTGRDYVYKLISIKRVPFTKSALTREDHLKIARDAVAAFDAA